MSREQQSELQRMAADLMGQSYCVCSAMVELSQYDQSGWDHRVPKSAHAGTSNVGDVGFGAGQGVRRGENVRTGFVLGSCVAVERSASVRPICRTDFALVFIAHLTRGTRSSSIRRT